MTDPDLISNFFGLFLLTMNQNNILGIRITLLEHQ